MPARVQVAPSLALEKQDSEREFADRRIDCGDGLETLTVTRRSQCSVNKLEAEERQPGQSATRHPANYLSVLGLVGPGLFGPIADRHTHAARRPYVDIGQNRIDLLTQAQHVLLKKQLLNKASNLSKNGRVVLC